MGATDDIPGRIRTTLYRRDAEAAGDGGTRRRTKAAPRPAAGGGAQPLPAAIAAADGRIAGLVAVLGLGLLLWARRRRLRGDDRLELIGGLLAQHGDLPVADPERPARRTPRGAAA